MLRLCLQTLLPNGIPGQQAFVSAGLLAILLSGLRVPTVFGQQKGPESSREFHLQDASGQPYQFSLQTSSRGTVLLFLGTECPLVRLYAPRFKDLAQFAQRSDLRFIGVDANVQDSADDVTGFAREMDLAFPIFLDPEAALADALKAQRTPEVFLLDPAGVVRYRGRLDDQFEVGIQRPAPTTHDFRDALEAFIEGDPIRRSETDAPGCRIGRAPRSDVEASNTSHEVTWSSPISGILAARCQHCHREGEIAPFSLTRYEDAAAWGETISEAVLAGRMPPWHANPDYGQFANEFRLTDSERQAILRWVDSGCPKGDPDPVAMLPPENDHIPGGWHIGPPDRILAIADAPFEVPASGTVEYQWFHVDPGFTQDQWVVASEVRPQARRAVHHATVYFHPPGRPWDLRLNDRIDLLAGFNPGGGPWRAPPGMAMKIPAGSQIVFEMHYTPTGRVEEDRTELGLKFVDPATVQREVHCVMPANTGLTIPPHTSNYQVETGFILPADSLLLMMRPHMHLRGKSFRYEAIDPQGNREILLDVPKYDFNWQHSYVLKEPKRLPLGTEIRCTAIFDNSDANPSNPDPEATVRWGDQSWEEMMIGIFSVAFVDKDLSVSQGATTTATTSRVQRYPLVGAILLALALALTWCVRRATVVRLSACVAALHLGTSVLAAETSEKTLVGRPMGEFVAVDSYGKAWSSVSLQDKPWLAVTFLGVECPLCKLYVPRLNDLAAKYEKDGVAFLAIDSNQQDSLEDIKRFIQEQGLTFPFLKDAGNVVADLFSAVRTPQVYLLDQERKVRYVGRIDDQYLPGVQRPKVTRADLEIALEEVLAGHPISQAVTTPAGCLIGRAKAPDEASPVTWSGQIAKIFQKRCQQCHRPGQIGPFSLLEYSEAAGWAEMIREVVSEGRMPPWHANPEFGHFANDIRLLPEERNAIDLWVEHGAPEGDPSLAPPPEQFPDGWQIDAPDEIVWMRPEPFEVPADGVLDYQYFTMDPKWTKDRWIQAVECRAGNRSVVHHMAVFLWLPGTEWIDSFKHFLSGNAQGWGHMIFPEGTARFVPKGTRFVFVMHYAPNGTPQTDRSYMGVRFADPASVTQSCRTVVAVADDFAIPPHAANYRVGAEYRIEADAWLISLFPHMHLRGKSFRYTAHFPDGTEEILLDIPRYDFGWQENYQLAERKLLPRGTVVRCQAVYDNSPSNLQNPDPSATVTWGFQSSDEMLDGHMQIATSLAADPLVPTWRRSVGPIAAAVIGYLLIIAIVAPLWLNRSRTSMKPCANPSAPQAIQPLALIFVYISLSAVPIVLLADTYSREAAGWSPESSPLANLFLLTVWGWIGAVTAVLFFPGGRRWLSEHQSRLLLATTSFWLCFLAADLVASKINPFPSFHRRSPGVTYSFAPDPKVLSGIGSSSTCHYNAWGLRGPELKDSPEAHRLLCIGGSTTECLYVNDSAHWPAQLSSILEEQTSERQWVGAAAISDYGTGQHLRLLQSWDELSKFDQIICLAGGGDLLRLLHGHDRGEIAPPWWYRSFTASKLRHLWNVELRKARIHADPSGKFYMHQRRFLSIHSPGKPIDFSAEIDAYQDRIRKMIATARQRGKDIIFVTQPVLWSDDLSADAKRRLLVARIFPAGREWDLLTPENLRGLMDRYNAALVETCASLEAPCVDAARSLNGDAALFLDDYHLNNAGCRKLAEIVASKLCAKSQQRQQRP